MTGVQLLEAWGLPDGSIISEVSKKLETKQDWAEWDRQLSNRFVVNKPFLTLYSGRFYIATKLIDGLKHAQTLNEFAATIIGMGKIEKVE